MLKKTNKTTYFSKQLVLGSINCSRNERDTDVSSSGDNYRLSPADRCDGEKGGDGITSQSRPLYSCHPLLSLCLSLPNTHKYTHNNTHAQQDTYGVPHIKKSGVLTIYFQEIHNFRLKLMRTIVTIRNTPPSAVSRDIYLRIGSKYLTSLLQKYLCVYITGNP